VLVPTFNYARFLPEALDSLLRQDFNDFEIIISDDASTDDSAEIIRAYAARDSRIRAHLQPVNLGMVANWNWCLRQARGRYIKYLFGDDRLGSPTSLGKMVVLLGTHPSAVMAVSCRSIIDENSRVVDCWNHLPAEGLHEGRAIIRQCLLRTDNFIGEPTAVMFRADRASRGFDPQYRQIVDLEMWCHLLKAGDLVYTTEPLCSFRRHSSQQSEVNRQDRVGSREYSRLLSTYLDHYIPMGTHFTAAERKYLFSAIYHLRKGRAIPAEMRAIEAVFLPKLGRADYAWHWLARKATRPFANLRRNWEKHVLRRTPAPVMASLAVKESPILPVPTPRIRALRRIPARMFRESSVL
jgi:glycosyltransferase involved in cell wall biosynthesis